MKAALVFCAIFLLFSHTYAQCIIANAVSSFDASCSTGSGCSLSASVIAALNPSQLTCALSALLAGVNLVIAPTGSGTLNLQLQTSGFIYSSLNITANPGVTLQVLANSAVNIASDLAVYGSAQVSLAANGVVSVGRNVQLSAQSTVVVATGTVLNVGASVQVASQATLRVAGNVTAATAVAISGTLYLAGTKVQTEAQTAWVVLRAAASSITFSGSASAAASIRGNGGFDGSVALSGNATIAAGNSPGTVYVNGDLDMDPTTTLEIEVASLTDFDFILIKKSFKRDGILYANFLNNYVPNNKDNFVFASHTASEGDFNVAHGNYLSATFGNVKPQYQTLSTSFQYSSATSVAVSLFAILVCTLLVL